MLRTLEHILSMYPWGIVFCCFTGRLLWSSPQQVLLGASLISVRAVFPCRGVCGWYLHSSADVRTAYPQQACVGRFPPVEIPTECLVDVSPGVSPAEFVMRMLFPSSWVCDTLSPARPWVLLPSRVVKVCLQYDMMCYHPHQSCSPQQSGVGSFFSKFPEWSGFQRNISPAEFILLVDWTSYRDRSVLASPAEFSLPVDWVGRPQWSSGYSPKQSCST